MAEQQSFRKAARALGVSNALVTRSIAMLETHLNARLIHRTTRSLSLTDAGTRYLDGCRTLLEEFDHLEASVVQTVREPAGTLRVIVSGALSPALVTPLVDGFRRRHPKVHLQLTLGGASVDVAESGHDVGIVAGTRPDGEATLAAHRLGIDPLALFAAPAYLERRGVPASPDALARHDCVAFGAERHQQTWRLVDAACTAHLVTVAPAYTVNSAWMLRSAVLAATGIGVLSESFAADALAAGTLVRVLPGYRIDDPAAQLTLVYPQRQFTPARTRTFVEYAIDHFGDAPAQPSSAPLGLLREPAVARRPGAAAELQ